MKRTNYTAKLVDEYPDWEGAKVLACLTTTPNTDIYATVLELSLQNAIPASAAENLRYHLAPIRMTDEATLKAVDMRLKALIAMKAETASPAYDAEIAALIAYRKDTTLPTGRIKCFNDDDTKAYWRQRNAIRRLLNKAEKDGHYEAVAYIKAHLKMGKIFRWEA